MSDAEKMAQAKRQLTEKLEQMRREHNTALANGLVTRARRIDRRMVALR